MNLTAPPISYDRCAEQVEDLRGQGIPDAPEMATWFGAGGQGGHD